MREAAEQQLYRSDRTQVTRSVSAEAGPVVRKRCIGRDARARATREASMLQVLAGVTGIPELVSPVGDADVVVRDVAGVTLGDLVCAPQHGPGAPWRVAELIDLGIELAGVIGEVHRRGVVHRDLSPANIVLQGSARHPVIIDFEFATTIADARSSVASADDIVGTLAYMAPEQTGRTGRPVDQRTDLYALGCTLYELARGLPPFGRGEVDALDLIHDHVARRPVPLYVLCPDLPRPFSDVVDRLLEKEPDRRYQSAEGLAHDLGLIRSQLLVRLSQTGGHSHEGDAGPDGGLAMSPPMRLGTRDYPLHFRAPVRLVARDRELAAQTAAFTDATAGRARALLVEGSAGIGKTALVEELRPVVTAAGGWYVAATFEQHAQDQRLDAATQAVSALGRMLLSQSQTELLAHRERLLIGLGDRAGLLAAVLPEFELLLGVEPEPPVGDPVHVQARVVQAALDVLRAVTASGRPLVVVLDGLQWASAFPLDLVDAVLTGDPLPGLLLVATSRDDEIDASHPLSVMLSRWEQLEVAPQRVGLENLSRRDLAGLLGEVLRIDAFEAAELAELVAVHTDGNPHDTIELLNALRQDGTLVPGPDGWIWDAELIRRHVGSAEGVDRIVARLDKLPGPACELLEVVGCLGGDVDLELLAAATGSAPAVLRGLLAPSLGDGLLVSGAAGDLDGGDALRLRHDAVRQSLLDRLTTSGRSRRHLEIARRLAQAGAAGPNGRSTFALRAAEQYLSAVGEVVDPQECRRALALFADAARAVQATSPAAAERYLAAALTTLERARREAGVAAGEGDEALSVKLETARHAALYSLGRFDEADRLYRSVEAVSARAGDILALVEAGCVQIASLTNRARPQEAVALGLLLLRQLGLEVPSSERLPEVIRHGLDDLYTWVDSSDEAADLERPEIRDPRVLAVADVVSAMMAPAFFSDLAVMAWLVLESRRIWAEHGPYRALVAPIGHAAVVTIAMREDYRVGYQVVRRIRDAGVSRGYELEASRARFLFAVSAGHWFEPLGGSLTEAKLAREGLLHGGESQVAVFTYHSSTPTHLDTAVSLDEYLVTVEAGLSLATRTGNHQTVGAGTPYRDLVLVLQGGERVGPDQGGDDVELAPDVAANPMAAVNTHMTRALAAALFGRTAALVRHAAAAVELLPFLQGHYAMYRVYLLQALALAAQVRAAGPDERATLLTELDACRAWIAARAADNEATFGHLLSIVDAERAWAVGDVAQARTAFDQALQQVGAGDRPWHRAFILERAAHFALDQNQEYVGRILLGFAAEAYAAWGARAKVDELEAAHPFLQGLGRNAGVSAARASVVGISADALDLMSVLRASQALSGETDLDALRVRVVDVLTTMTGATHVTVLLRTEDGEGWVRPDDGAETAPETLAATVPLSAIRYAERTEGPVVVADVARDQRFAGDPYLVAHGGASLLVVPVLSRGRATVMLVLENELHRGVFSLDRLDAVMLIAGQLAVSFDTALARRQLEQEADRRLQLLGALRSRERLLETLLAIQRDISHRAPLQSVLDAVTAGASVLLDGDYVALVLADPTSTAVPFQIRSVSGPVPEPGREARVLAVAAASISSDEVVAKESGATALTAAPVHVGGEIIGSLVTGNVAPSMPVDARHDLLAERHDLLAAFAEQVSLALNDATTLKAIRLASLDSLTGLASRSLFLECLDAALAVPGAVVSVLFIDLDRFKQVNDSLGHGAGDELLAGVAERIRGCIRDGDTAARLGGDEFAILLQNGSAPTAGMRVAEALTTSLLKHFDIAGKEIFVTASVGVAIGSGDLTTAPELLKQADLAMYRAKRERARRPVLFEPQMHEDVAKRLDLEGDLQRAVMAEQLWLQFQPQLEVRGGAVVGVEALVRWTHPEQGPISPATFVPIAEDTGVVVDLGRWVLREACRQVARWRQEIHPQLGVSVNISGRQLTDGRLAEDVAAVLAETGLDAAALTLELTESILMEDPVESLARLQELKRLGVLLSLDDFGTGYSSLSYLHRFPVDELKIDRSFIEKIDTTEADLAIVRAVVELARILQLRVTAEGVETGRQRDLLAELGCEVGQGYLFSRPLSGEDVPAYLALHRIPRQGDGSATRPAASTVGADGAVSSGQARAEGGRA